MIRSQKQAKVHWERQTFLRQGSVGWRLELVSVGEVAWSALID